MTASDHAVKLASIAALAAEGISRVEGVNLIDRGYEHFMSKLSALNADVVRLA